MNNLVTISLCGTALISLLMTTGATLAQNKVVVVPLGSDTGISGYEILTAQSSGRVQVGNGLVAEVNCSAGKQVLGGGAESNNDNALVITKNFPLTGSEIGWKAVVLNRGQAEVIGNLTVYVICANVMN